jgi:dienelactone hydrolase
MTSAASAFIAGAALAAGLAWQAAAAEDLTVLTPTAGGTPPGAQFEVWLKRQFYAQVDRRSAAFEKLKSTADCRAWQEERRAFFLRQLGGLPERTPLNARVVGTLAGQGYRIENVLFESRPNFHVSANLYLPATPPPWPAVLVPCGHSHDGKAAGGYQRMCILLARHGMAAMCYDPIGQGERYQMLDLTREHTHFQEAKRVPTPHPNVHVLCTVEHTAMGLGCILTGTNVAQFRIWDGMRAIDYLQSRPDIIADKIGCTGNSGGGTLTSYLMALDDRIAAAAPVCYLTTFRRLIDTRGAQDAEQNIFGQIAFGMDQADYAIMRAPKPTLICAGTRDATFDIRGTWEVFREAKRFYSRLNHAERVEMHEVDAPHGMGIQQREAAARWMHRWLLGSDKVIREVEQRPDPVSDEQLRELSKGDWTQEQLQCTPKGQVLLMPGEKSVFEINSATAAMLREKRAKNWAALTDSDKRGLVQSMIDPHPEDPPTSFKAAKLGRLGRNGYTIEKLALTVDEGLGVPGLLFQPSQPSGRRVLYLHGDSMSADATPGGPIEALVREGAIVLSAELRGIGETETGHGKSDYGYGRFGRDNQEIFLAYLMGKSFIGMRVADIEAWTQFLAEQNSGGLELIAIGEAAIPALHFAALRPETCRAVTLRGMVRSWEQVVRNPHTLNQAVNLVHGALVHYDLPDLISLAGPEKVRLETPADVMGRPLQ